MAKNTTKKGDGMVLTRGALACLAGLAVVHNSGVSLFRTPQELFYMNLLLSGPLKGLDAADLDEAQASKPGPELVMAKPQFRMLQRALKTLADSGQMKITAPTVELLRKFELVKEE